MPEPWLYRGKNLTVEFPGAWGTPSKRALKNISLSLAPGDSLGLAGESGSGKTTLARVIAGLQRPSQGQGFWNSPGRPQAPPRGWVGMIFQDARGSLDPRQRAGDAVAEPLRVLQGLGPGESRNRSLRMFERVGLQEAHSTRFPHELSGGQAQRVALARALAPGPRLLIADEPVSALDVSIQSQILNLILDQKMEMGFALVLVTHDLSLLPAMCQRTMVLRRGSLVEKGPSKALLSKPKKPYTRELVQASLWGGRRAA